MRHTVLPVVGAAVVLLTAPVSASEGTAVFHARPIVRVAANKSQNWFGYNQGALERGTMFHQVTAAWVVPTATQHVAGQTEYSATWAGIGGGCVDAGCLIVDNTLIQAGTEQDVGAGGRASYSAWWEVLPGPSIGVNMLVRPGDQMYLSLVESPANSEVWHLTLRDDSRHELFTQTIPYSSSYASAEWIDEAPVIVGADAGVAPLPNLTITHFDQATANGVNPALNAAEEMDLVDSNGNVIGSPSGPDPERDGFNDCAWASRCSTPAASMPVLRPLSLHTKWLTIGG